VKGKVVLWQFWTTWCPYCRGEQSLVDDEFAAKGLVVLAIDVGESNTTVRKYLADHPRSCRIVLNEDTNLVAMYAAVYPIYVVIDLEGGSRNSHGSRCASWTKRPAWCCILPSSRSISRQGGAGKSWRTSIRQMGYVIVARNCHSRRRPREIDLVGWDGDVLCFIEVRTRTTHDVKPAEAAVGGWQAIRVPDLTF